MFSTYDIRSPNSRSDLHFYHHKDTKKSSKVGLALTLSIFDNASNEGRPRMEQEGTQGMRDAGQL